MASQPFRAEGASKMDFVLDWDEVACALTLPLIEDSNAQFTGRVSVPETDQLEQKQPAKSVRMRGALELSYPEECPRNYDEVLSTLKEAKFSGSLETNHVVFQTIVADSPQNDLELMFDGVRVVLESSAPLRLRNGQFGVAFQVALVGGMVSAVNETFEASMELNASTFGAASGLIEKEGKIVMLSIPNLAFSFSIRPPANETFPLRLELAFIANIFSKVDFPNDRAKKTEPIAEIQATRTPPRVPELNPTVESVKDPKPDASGKSAQDSGQGSLSPAEDSSTSNDASAAMVFESDLRISPLLVEDADRPKGERLAPEVAILSDNGTNKNENDTNIFILEVDMDGDDLTIAAGFLAIPFLALFVIFAFFLVHMCSQWSKYYTYFTRDMHKMEFSEKAESETEGPTTIGGNSGLEVDEFEEIEPEDGVLGNEPLRKLVYEDIFCAIRLHPITERVRHWKESRGLLPAKDTPGWESVNKLAFFEFEGQKYRTALHVASGALPSGELTAILGPPESGKGLLIRLLAGNVSHVGKRDILKGSITMIKSQELKKKKKKEHWRMGLVTEDVSYEDALTVSEVLGIWVAMKGPWGFNISNQKIRYSINEAAKRLSLWEKLHVRVSSLTTLEKRKLMIACELAKMPTALFLDNSLLGLDAHDALELMSILRRISQDDKIVTITMDQSSPDQFQLIDHLLMMSHGHLLYDGPTSQINGFLCQVGYPCPPRVPIPTHILSAISDPSVLHRLICLVKNAYETRNADALMSILTTKDFINTCVLESTHMSMHESMSTLERVEASSSDRSESKAEETRNILAKKLNQEEFETSSFRSLHGFWKNSTANARGDGGGPSSSTQHQESSQPPLRIQAEVRRTKAIAMPWKQIVLKKVEGGKGGENDPPCIEETWSFSDTSMKKEHFMQTKDSYPNPTVTYIGHQWKLDGDRGSLDSLQMKRTSGEEGDSFFATTQTDFFKRKSQDAPIGDQMMIRPHSVSVHQTIPLAGDTIPLDQTDARDTTRSAMSDRLSMILSNFAQNSNPAHVESTVELASHRVNSMRSLPESVQVRAPKRAEQEVPPLPPIHPNSRPTPSLKRRSLELQISPGAVSDPGTLDYGHLEAVESPQTVEIVDDEPTDLKHRIQGISDKMLTGLKTALLALGLMRSTSSLAPSVNLTQGAPTITESIPAPEVRNDSETIEDTSPARPVVCKDLVYDNIGRKHSPKSEWPSEIAVLLLNMITGLFRKKTGILIHLSLAIICGLLLSLLYQDLDEDINGLQSRTSAVFFTLSILTIAAVLPIRQLTIRRQVILRDLKSGNYQPSSFLCAQFLPDVVFLKFLAVCLFSLSFLFISNFSLEFDRVLIFIFGLTVFWATLYYTFFAIILLTPQISVESNPECCLMMSFLGVTYAMIGIVALYGLLFCGYLIPKQDLNGVIRSFTAISPMCNAFEMIVLSQLSAYSVSTMVAISEIDEFKDSLGHASHESMGLDTSRVFVDAIVLILLLFSMVVTLYGVIKWNLYQCHPGTKQKTRSWKKQSLLQAAMKTSRLLLMGQDSH